MPEFCGPNHPPHFPRDVQGGPSPAPTRNRACDVGAAPRGARPHQTRLRAVMLSLKVGLSALSSPEIFAGRHWMPPHCGEENRLYRHMSSNCMTHAGEAFYHRDLQRRSAARCGPIRMMAPTFFRITFPWPTPKRRIASYSNICQKNMTRNLSSRKSKRRWTTCCRKLEDVAAAPASCASQWEVYQA